MPKLESKDIVDTNGAGHHTETDERHLHSLITGDAFVGGFFAALMKGKSEQVSASRQSYLHRP